MSYKESRRRRWRISTIRFDSAENPRVKKRGKGVWANRLEIVAKHVRLVVDKSASARMKGEVWERPEAELEAAGMKMMSFSLRSTRMNRIRVCASSQSQRAWKYAL